MKETVCAALILEKGEIGEYKTGPRDIVQMLQYEKQREMVGKGT